MSICNGQTAMKFTKCIYGPQRTNLFHCRQSCFMFQPMHQHNPLMIRLYVPSIHNHIFFFYQNQLIWSGIAIREFTHKAKIHAVLSQSSVLVDVWHEITLVLLSLLVLTWWVLMMADLMDLQVMQGSRWRWHGKREFGCNQRAWG